MEVHCSVGRAPRIRLVSCYKHPKHEFVTWATVGSRQNLRRYQVSIMKARSESKYLRPVVLWTVKQTVPR